MIRKVLRRVRVNFRSSDSQRAANASYMNYHKRIERFLKRVPIWKKKNRQNNNV